MEDCNLYISLPLFFEGEDLRIIFSGGIKKRGCIIQ